MAEPKPYTPNAFETALGRAGNMVLAGYLPEIVEYVGGPAADTTRQALQRGAEANPTANTVGTGLGVAGAIYGAGKLIRGAQGLIGGGLRLMPSVARAQTAANLARPVGAAIEKISKMEVAKALGLVPTLKGTLNTAATVGVGGLAYSAIPQNPAEQPNTTQSTQPEFAPVDTTLVDQENQRDAQIAAYYGMPLALYRGYMDKYGGIPNRALANIQSMRPSPVGYKERIGSELGSVIMSQMAQAQAAGDTKTVDALRQELLQLMSSNQQYYLPPNE